SPDAGRRLRSPAHPGPSAEVRWLASVPGSLCAARSWPPSSLVVLFVGQDMPDIDSLAVEVDGRNQPVIVPTYVEDDQAFHPISAWECPSQVIEVLEVLRPRLAAARTPPTILAKERSVSRTRI